MSDPRLSQQLITAAELKSLLSCSLAWVRKETQLGRLPFIRLGLRGIRYSVTEVVEHLRAQQQSK